MPHVGSTAGGQTHSIRRTPGEMLLGSLRSRSGLPPTCTSGGEGRQLLLCNWHVSRRGWWTCCCYCSCPYGASSGRGTLPARSTALLVAINTGIVEHAALLLHCQPLAITAASERSNYETPALNRFCDHRSSMDHRCLFRKLHKVSAVHVTSAVSCPRISRLNSQPMHRFILLHITMFACKWCVLQCNMS